MNVLKSFARPTVGTITPYEPGKPIEEVQREYDLKDVIKLASNENPLGPSRKAMVAIEDAIKTLHRYPDGNAYYLKQKLASKFDIPSNMIVMGNGSAELVELVTEAFIGDGDEAVIGKYAFFKYRIAVQIMNGLIAWAEMPGLRQDARALLQKISPQTRVIFIANPNNPTGTLMDRAQVEYLMKEVPDNVIVVFDEAYYDYRNPDIYPDTMKLLREGRNIIILRTMSKSYGLAGLRIGYAFTTPSLAQAMNTVREAFNVNSLAQVAAIAALDDNEFLQEGLRLNEQGKRQFYLACERLRVEYIPSEANFVLIKTPIPGRELFKLLLRRGVVVRPVDGYGLPEFVRVSIGLPREMERFFTELGAILQATGQKD